MTGSTAPSPSGDQQQRPATRLTRRRMVGLGAGAAVLGAAGATTIGVGLFEGWLPGHVRIGTLLGLAGDPVPPPSGPSGRVNEATFDSDDRPGTPEPWAWSTPGDVDPRGLPVVVFLHGWNGDHHHCFEQLGLGVVQAQVAQQTGKPFVLASLDGGGGYWHRRADGTDWAGLVLDLLDELQGLGADTSRLGLIGLSMGAFGALRLAAEELHGKVRAVGAMSTALYPDWENCPQGDAFDSPADFAANGLASGRERLHGLPVHLACGLNDMYLRANRQLAEELAGHAAPGEVQTAFPLGDHSNNFWRKASPAQLRFIVDRL